MHHSNLNKKRAAGFTLIEIVLVLVLLGVLAAIAAPKYFDLRERAERDAAQEFVNAFCAEVNARTAAALMANGGNCYQTLWGNNQGSDADTSMVGKVAKEWYEDFQKNGGDFMLDPNSQEINPNATTITILSTKGDWPAISGLSFSLMKCSDAPKP